MSAHFHRGLVVGKFCPLHHGHELLIDTAIAQCDEVVVLSYTNPGFAHCEATARERWLAERFPGVRRLVLDAARFVDVAASHGWPGEPRLPHNDDSAASHRELCAWLCHRVLKVTVDAVFTSEAYGDGFAAALTAYFRREWNHGCVEVTHVCVDAARSRVPVSGTAIRAGPHAHRELLSPTVYADFVQRVCLLGGESTGKTSLAQALAGRLDTAWVPEYGRELWEAKDGNLAFDDLLAIAREQVSRERLACRAARRWLVCDTSPLTTLLYCRELFARAEPELERLARRAYDRVFLCAPDFPFVQDGTRRDEAFRQHQHQWYLRELTARGVQFQLLEGSPDQRLAEALRVLAASD